MFRFEYSVFVYALTGDVSFWAGRCVV